MWIGGGWNCSGTTVFSQDYIHKFPVIICVSIQREYHEPCFPPNVIKRLQLLRRLANTGTSSAMIAEIH